MWQRRAGLACVLLAASAGAASAQVPAGPSTVRVNTYTTGTQDMPRVAVEPDGDFVVVWQSRGQDGSGEGVFGQRYDSAGARRGLEFRLNAYTDGDQSQPVVAVGPAGDFVTAWRDGEGVAARRFDASGQPIGTEFPVAVHTSGLQDAVEIGRAADGRVVVVWASDLRDGSGRSVAARLIDAEGAPVGSEFIVNTTTAYDQWRPAVAVQPTGGFVVVWENQSPRVIAARSFDREGVAIGAEFVVNNAASTAAQRPSVGMAPDGRFAVAWTHDFGMSRIKARRFDASATPTGGEFFVDMLGVNWSYSYPGSVALDESARFVVAWQNTSVTQARRVDWQGLPGASLPNVALLSGVPATASDGVGNFVVVWRDVDDGDGTGIAFRRYGGLSPAALTVADANGVLDPGETATLRPSWRNINGATQVFAGSLVSFTGPAGFAYTVDDPLGDYGAVPDGAVAACTDCYAISVSSASPRPRPHVDASLAELITPDVHGQQKRWTLHIGASFSDVPRASPFYPFIETLLHRGVTGGCTSETYCPLSSTSREQVAVFVLVSREGADYQPTACAAGSEMFGDVTATSPFCRWVEELARRGVAGGCGGGNFCPDTPVARDQMAVLVLRTLDPALVPPACTTPMFADVPASSPFCRWVEELARRGVVTGCGGGNYCPGSPVTREQMAVFLTATFGLTLYGV